MLLGILGAHNGVRLHLYNGEDVEAIRRST